MWRKVRFSAVTLFHRSREYVSTMSLISYNYLSVACLVRSKNCEKRLLASL